jgi:hypothetical protein
MTRLPWLTSAERAASQGGGSIEIGPRGKGQGSRMSGRSSTTCVTSTRPVSKAPSERLSVSARVPMRTPSPSSRTSTRSAVMEGCGSRLRRIGPLISTSRPRKPLAAASIASRWAFQSSSLGPIQMMATMTTAPASRNGTGLMRKDRRCR